MSSIIPFLDVGAAYRELQCEIDAAIQRVLSSGCYILGEEVEAFEAEWASYCHASYAVGVSNGLDALTLSLMALGIGEGDEILVPTNTYIATWLAVTAVGARVIPIEPDPITHTIDPSRIEEALTPAAKAIVAVHLYGHPASLDPLRQLAQKHNLFLIEDAAQAHGACYFGTPIGAHGDAVCWSFYPTKNLGALGDAGAITTNNSDLAHRLRLLRNYGSSRKYHHEIIGRNARLDPIQAAILRVKLKYLDIWNQRRAQNARRYCEALSSLPIQLPSVAPYATHAWHLFVIRISQRDRFQSYLARHGIETLIHYPTPPHRQPAYRDTIGADRSFPIAELLAREVLSLPIGPHLTAAEQARIIETIHLYHAHPPSSKESLDGPQ
ncbi:MAG: DegT/DnrJ/EryC1/StrS family aminotransferase [Hydrogenophilus sp.]|nr:DegT/DnrJ/EryC1/StrS family aminotransferase [Hydrogenophilus sp.]